MATSCSTDPKGKGASGDRVNLRVRGRGGEDRAGDKQDDLSQTQPYLLEECVHMRGLSGASHAASHVGWGSQCTSMDVPHSDQERSRQGPW